ncbi:stealth family protein [Demequina sp. NBRC 110053]|uniref:stealth family protein n=1 Tax=Demequina sp. NBRC 110053 TaxID=1570342 RepID=UPI00118600BF|nr:stealth family protein [Demequina sp. NBRC 110053]
MRTALDEQGVRHLLLPAKDEFSPKLVVSASDAMAVRRALAGLSSTDGWSVTFRETSQRAGGDSSDFLVAKAWRNIDGPERRLTSKRETVRILAFAELEAGTPRVDGETFERGTLHRRTSQPATPFAYFEPREWESYAGDSRATPDLPPLIDAVVDPIDVVYTWVDGSDPHWLERKARKTGSIQTEGYNDAADVASRFANRDELRYSLRSLEMHVPWVRHVYIVTDRQRPSWLVEDHPRVTVIDHEEIFTDPSVLPVFNSHAIESQLHHIPGLSDRYLYLNDDIMFGRPVSPTLFFGPGGVTKFFRSNAVLDIAPPSPRDLPVLSAAKNNRQLIADAFCVTVANKFKHTPHPQRKDVLEELEASLPAVFASTSRSSLRHPWDISIASALHHYWAYASGRAHEGEIRYSYIDLARRDVDLWLARLRHNRKVDVFCLNETNASPEQSAHLDRVVPAFLETMFPVPSTFERE